MSTKTSHPNLDISTLESWLWEAACKIRGPIDAPKFKDYILPLIFLKRLSNVFADEVAALGEQYGDPDIAQQLVEADHSLVRFYIPPHTLWSHLAQRSIVGLGEALTDAVRAVSRENPRLAGVIDVTDFNATTAGQRIISDEHLHELVQVLNRYRLGLHDVEPDILGRAYEYLLRKFAEGQGQSAGEFYTPRMVGVLMSRLLDPQPGMSIYDPACGSGGLLIKCHLRLVERFGIPTPNPSLKGGELISSPKVEALSPSPKGEALSPSPKGEALSPSPKGEALSPSPLGEGRGEVMVRSEAKALPSTLAPLKVFGQEINPTTFAMARMNAFIHDIEAEIALGDTMRNPRFLQEDGSLRSFDLVTANPMWNQTFPTEMYENDPFERFSRGIPPSSSADWGWVQHMVASLNPNGLMAVVLDTGSVSRGSGNQGSNRERDIRKLYVEGDMVTKGDLVETVILLPENLFYNTTAPGIIMVLNKNKSHPGEILLINASKSFVKGRPKNELANEHVTQIAELYHGWKAEEGLSKIISTAEAVRNDYNLSPSRYVSTNDKELVLPLEEAMVLLEEAEEERTEADIAMREALTRLGLIRSHIGHAE